MLAHQIDSGLYAGRARRSPTSSARCPPRSPSSPSSAQGSLQLRLPVARRTTARSATSSAGCWSTCARSSSSWARASPSSAASIRSRSADEDYYLDLLFYHLRLAASWSSSSRSSDFKPEYAGKMNFYLVRGRRPAAPPRRQAHHRHHPLQEAATRSSSEYALRDTASRWASRSTGSRPRYRNDSRRTCPRLKSCWPSLRTVPDRVMSSRWPEDSPLAETPSAVRLSTSRLDVHSQAAIACSNSQVVIDSETRPPRHSLPLPGRPNPPCPIRAAL